MNLTAALTFIHMHILLVGNINSLMGKCLVIQTVSYLYICKVDTYSIVMYTVASM